MSNVSKIIKSIENLRKNKEVVVVAIDGRAASGKTTTAFDLSNKLDGKVAVLHMDDFFLPSELRTAKRFETPGSNFHYERFKEEVLPFLHSGKPFDYGKFDCKIMDYAQNIKITKYDVIIVEGAYSLHPILGEYAHLKIFLDVDEEEQMRCIEKRNGVENAKIFKERWIPLEEEYFKYYGIREKAHMILS